MKVYLSEKANSELLHYIAGEGHEIVSVPKRGDVTEAIACHPDLYYCLLPGGIYEGDGSLLSEEYPADVLYNAAAVGRYFICSKFTYPGLAAEAEARGLLPVRVPQGYVKCNLAVLDGCHVITEDRGIAKVLSALPDIECLLISPGYVRLPGYEYGFIGGCCGRVGKKMVFNGDINAHPDGKEIVSLCEKCGLEPVGFSSYPLTDIGSILAI